MWWENKWRAPEIRLGSSQHRSALTTIHGPVFGQTRPRGIRVMENQFYKRFATAVLRSRPQIIQAQRAFTNRKKIKYEKNGSSRLTETHFWPWCQTTSRIKQRRSNGMQEEARRGAGVGRRDTTTLPPAPPFPLPFPSSPRAPAPWG